MKRTTLLCACAVMMLIACGEKKAPKSPEAVVEEPTSEESDAKKAATSTPEAPGAPGDKTAAPSTDSKPACASLQKSVCKVTQGCAWYEQGAKSKCIDEGSQP